MRRHIVEIIMVVIFIVLITGLVNSVWNYVEFVLQAPSRTPVETAKIKAVDCTVIEKKGLEVTLLCSELPLAPSRN